MQLCEGVTQTEVFARIVLFPLCSVYLLLNNPRCSGSKATAACCVSLMKTKTLWRSSYLFTINVLTACLQGLDTPPASLVTPQPQHTAWNYYVFDYLMVGEYQPNAVFSQLPRSARMTFFSFPFLVSSSCLAFSCFSCLFFSSFLSFFVFFFRFISFLFLFFLSFLVICFFFQLTCFCPAYA